MQTIHPVPETVETGLIPLLLSQTGFGEWVGDSTQVKGMSIQQALSLRTHLLRNKAMKRSYLLKTNWNKIKKAYASRDARIIAIASKFDLPPMSIMRKIVRDKYNVTLAVIFKKPQLLDKKDRAQFEQARKHDIIEGRNPNMTLVYADAFEADVGHWLLNQGHAFLTQADMVKIQMKKYGKAVATPDFYFNQPIKIKGKPIHWIDAKNYYGTTKSMIYPKTIEQATRYVNRFGPGAIVFALGCSTGVVIDKVSMLHVPRTAKTFVS